MKKPTKQEIDTLSTTIYTRYTLACGHKTSFAIGTLSGTVTETV